MNESIAILVFILLMFLRELSDIRKIQIKARKKPCQMLMSVFIAIGLVALFWSNKSIFDLRLLTFVALVLFYGFAPQGIGSKRVIKVGILNGDLDKYQKIELESCDPSSHCTKVWFYKKKNSVTVLEVKGNVRLVQKYLCQHVNSKIVQIKS